MQRPVVWMFPVGPSGEIAQLVWDGLPAQEDVQMVIDILRLQQKYGVYSAKERAAKDEAKRRTERLKRFLRNLEQG